MELIFLVIPVISYLLGTIPSGFLIVKYATGIDIRLAGTGNMGALNSFDITQKKWIGITVTIMDAGKGMLAVIIANILGSNDYFAIGMASFFVVLGHNFNVFFKFKGGRGLASALGVFFIINPFLIVLWGLMWLAGFYIIKKQVHVASVTATIGTPFLAYYTPEKLLNIFMIFISGTKNSVILTFIAVGILILIGHAKPFIDVIKGQYQE